MALSTLVRIFVQANSRISRVLRDSVLVNSGQGHFVTKILHPTATILFVLTTSAGAYSIYTEEPFSVPSVKQQSLEVETYKVIQDDGLTIVQLPDEFPKSSSHTIGLYAYS